MFSIVGLSIWKSQQIPVNFTVHSTCNLSGHWVYVNQLCKYPPKKVRWPLVISLNMFWINRYDKTNLQKKSVLRNNEREVMRISKLSTSQDINLDLMFSSVLFRFPSESPIIHLMQRQHTAQCRCHHYFKTDAVVFLICFCTCPQTWVIVFSALKCSLQCAASCSTAPGLCREWMTTLLGLILVPPKHTYD